MIELVRRVAAADPARPAVVTHDVDLSYADLLAAAGRAAAAMARDGVARVAIADHEAPVVLPLLAGASAVATEACILPPDPADVVAELVTRFEQPVVVTDRDDLAGVLPTTRLVRPAAWLSDAVAVPEVGTPLDLPATVRPHLVLTTGTTGAPRGVRHDWHRLVGTVRRVEPDSGAGQRWLLAYGLHQFAGLQVLLHVLAAGATLVAPAPRRPREGLAAMRALGVTHASATPTYWRFLMAEMRADGGPVPALQQVTLGGEAVPGPLLDDVERTFAGAHVSQVYAASEFGSTGSTRDRKAGLPLGLLDRGDDADVAVRIVDGELWVRSRGSMLGYHGEPPVDPDAWRATGDLVAVEGDRIVFCGRTSEIINVGGVKVHPLLVEERISAVPGVDVVRAFGRPNPMVGHIVAVEVVADPEADPVALAAAVRAACADLPAAARPRSVRLVETVSTAGGKIVRRQP